MNGITTELTRASSLLILSSWGDIGGQMPIDMAIIWRSGCSGLASAGSELNAGSHSRTGKGSSWVCQWATLRGQELAAVWVVMVFATGGSRVPARLGSYMYVVPLDA